MSNYKFLYPVIRTCQSETEISNLFERHTKLLYDQKQKMITEIIEWEKNLIRQIQEYVNKQKYLLEQQSKYQLDYLQTKRREYLDTALFYEDRNDREEVRQLLERCHALKFGLDSFDYLEKPILFIQLQKEQLPTEVKQDSTNMFKSEKKPMNNNDLNTADNRNIYTSASSRSTLTSSHQINQQSINENVYLASNNNVINNRKMVDKCPACFMIFPSNMGTNERSKHVNQHFGDN